MFHDIPDAVLERMRWLEEQDAADRQGGTPRMQRLRQVGPETGRFLTLLAALAPAGRWVEVGTSAGYSALWLSLACRRLGRRLTTYEILEEKAALARETFACAGVGDVVELVVGDARAHLATCEDIAFCFLDADKEVYADCYEAVVPNMVSGGLLVADNFSSHGEILAPLRERIEGDERVDCLVVTIGKGEMVCRKL